MLEYIILGFLMRRKATGYDLKQYMAESTSYFFDASYGSIYPALKRLEEKKFLCSEEQVTGGKFKKLYSVTGELNAVYRRSFIGARGAEGPAARTGFQLPGMPPYVPLFRARLRNPLL